MNKNILKYSLISILIVALVVALTSVFSFTSVVSGKLYVWDTVVEPGNYPEPTTSYFTIYPVKLSNGYYAVFQFEGTDVNTAGTYGPDKGSIYCLGDYRDQGLGIICDSRNTAKYPNCNLKSVSTQIYQYKTKCEIDAWVYNAESDLKVNPTKYQPVIEPTPMPVIVDDTKTTSPGTPVSSPDSPDYTDTGSSLVDQLKAGLSDQPSQAWVGVTSEPKLNYVKIALVSLILIIVVLFVLSRIRK